MSYSSLCCVNVETPKSHHISKYIDLTFVYDKRIWIQFGLKFSAALQMATFTIFSEVKSFWVSLKKKKLSPKIKEFGSQTLLNA